MKIFGDYARYYDLLNDDKDYQAEVDYIISLIKDQNIEAKTILNLGCGTGKHDILLEKAGYFVTGLDSSQSMIQRAEKNSSTDKCKHLEFIQGDLRYLKIDRKFDVVLSLFHVISYQKTNSDLAMAFLSANRHLREKGIFIFDCWYGPAVLNQLPENRNKCVEIKNLLIRRNAVPFLHPELNIVDVNYKFVVLDKINKEKHIFNELHSMRYLFSPEVNLLAKNSGFKVLKAFQWMTNKNPSLFSWNVVFILRS